MGPVLLVLAAGMGSRYGGLKQLDRFGPNGESIIDYSIYDAIKCGFKGVIFVIREEIEDSFRELVGDKFKRYIDVKYVFQKNSDLPKGYTLLNSREKPWGTGHAILVAKDLIDSHFVVINGDDFYGRESFRTIFNFFIDKPPDTRNLAMVAFKLRNTLSKYGSVSRGICYTNGNDNMLNGIKEFVNIAEKNGTIVGIDSNGKEEIFTGEKAVSMNMWGLSPAIFEKLEELFCEFLEKSKDDATAEFYLPFAIDRMIKSRDITIEVLKSNERWFGVTNRDDRSYVKDEILSLISKGVYPKRLFNQD